MDFEELRQNYLYHPPNKETAELHELVRDECFGLANFFNGNLPDSREKSIALTKVQEAMWAANAAIAIHISGKESDAVQSDS